MYCPKCKISVAEGVFCPVCGEPLHDEGKNELLIDDNCSDKRGRKTNSEPGCKFNFSKPLCLIFAAVLLLSMMLPWFSVKVHLNVGEKNFDNDLKLSMLDAQSEFSKLVHMFDAFKEAAGPDADMYSDILWLANGMILLLTGYFMLAAFFILLFGIIGLFTKGRARYFFARAGSSMYAVGLVIAAAAILLVNGYINFVSETAEEFGLTGLGVRISVTLWLAVSFVLAIAFRIFGIRALRVLNGTSCARRGYNDIARREFSLLHKKRRHAEARRKYRKKKPVAGDESDELYGDEPED